MDAAWEAGITTFDTADAYGGGRSESFIGNWLRTKGAEVRDRIVLTTKTFNPMSDGADHGLVARRGSSASSTAASSGSVSSRSRSTSRTTWIRPCRWPRRSARSTLSSQQGKIRAYGGSNVDVAWLEEALREGRPDWVQNSYSLLDREAEAGVLEVCAAKGWASRRSARSPAAGSRASTGAARSRRQDRG